ncbi:hypothetical protein AAG906_026276 [Vitis piasezkii]
MKSRGTGISLEKKKRRELKTESWETRERKTKSLRRRKTEQKEKEEHKFSSIFGSYPNALSYKEEERAVVSHGDLQELRSSLLQGAYVNGGFRLLCCHKQWQWPSSPLYHPCLSSLLKLLRRKVQKVFMIDFLMGGVSIVVSKSAAAPIERVKLLIQNRDEIIKSAMLSELYKGITDCFARTIKNEDNTSTPREVLEVGNFTAGAIVLIALKDAVAVVDGNVVRVISRLKAISSNPKQSATIKNIWRLIGQMVDPCRPGDFNQALMELGANIRIPLNPRCSAYPGAPIDKSSEDRTEPEEKPEIYTKQNPEIRAQNSVDGELKSETRETKTKGGETNEQSAKLQLGDLTQRVSRLERR